MKEARPCAQLMALLPAGHGEARPIVDGRTIAAVRLRDLTVGIDTELGEITCSAGRGADREILLRLELLGPDVAAKLASFFRARFSDVEEREV